MSLTELADHIEGPNALDPASPDWGDALDRFLITLRQQPPSDEASLARVEQVLIFCLDQPFADRDTIGDLALSMLFNQQAAGLISQFIASDPSGQNLWFLQNPVLRRIVLSPLLVVLLKLRPVTNSHGEWLLTALRSGLLLDWTDKRLLEDEHWRLLTPLLNGMAVQGALTDYAWMIEPGERAALHVVLDQLQQAPSPALMPAFLLAASYQPLTASPVTAAIAQRPAEELTAMGLEQAVLDWHVNWPAAQQRHAASIETRGQFRSDVSVSVGQHYEEHPYPSWSQLLPLPPMSVPFYLAQDLGYQPAQVPTQVSEVLVAGCGTGQHPLQLAKMLSEATIDAMDLSRSSLGYAAMMAERLGLRGRVHLFQADILDLPQLGGRYHLIEAAGVIHHMEEPAAGLAALNACLKPGGWLRLGLYSEYARRSIRQLRATYGQDQTLEDQGTLRQLRRAILQDPSEAARAASLMADFYTLPGFRDLLFHRQEHRFTIPQIAEMFAAEGLEFMGFSFPQAAIRILYRQNFPDDASMCSLENWDAFERANPDTFLSMYNFWCRKPG